MSCVYKDDCEYKKCRCSFRIWNYRHPIIVEKIITRNKGLIKN